MQFPTPNLNGQTPASAVEDLSRAINSLEMAQICLHAVAPHGRDYQLAKDSKALEKAIKEHSDREERLRNLMHELGLLRDFWAEHVYPAPSKGRLPNGPTAPRGPTGSNM